MGMSVQEEMAPVDEINVTPMLDLAYVLLVIFIIMMTASVQGVKVNLPKARMTGNVAKPHIKAVTVSESGSLFIDAYPVNLEELESRLRQLKAANPAQGILVKGDARVQYEKVMQVLEAAKRVDITDIGLVTSRVKE